MLKGLYTAYTGMINEQHRMDTMSNNLANAATTGFKKEGSTSQSFDSVLAYKIRDNSEAKYVNRRIGANDPGVKIGENYTDFSQGSFKITGNTFDLALGCDGFFAVAFTNKAGETSTKYTRDGSFTLTSEGYLVTKDGDFVQGTNGYIEIDPTKETTIDQSGRVMQDGVILDQIRVVDFADYDYLEHYGENLYQPVAGATLQEVQPQIFSGYLEASNVSTVMEMVNLITITRAYEANQKIVQTYDSSLEIAVNQLGKLR